MDRKFWIKAGHCCGALCAYLYYGIGSMTDRVVAKRHDEVGFLVYAKAAYGSLAEKKAEWDSWYASILDMLKQQVEGGAMTKEQAEAALKAWLEEHPNPDPEQQAYDVTEEFARSPIKIPVRVEERE